MVFRVLQNYKKSSIPCPEHNHTSIDLIFTDIMGLQKIKKQMKSFYVEYW
jgi:hypothetical protein